MDYDTPITAELVRQLLDYDPETGLLTWRARSARMFKNGKYPPDHVAATWNAKYAGTVAGRVSSLGYIGIGIFYRRYPAHHLAWLHVYGAWPIDKLDHVNGDPKDNRIANLREASQAQNCQNTRPRKGATSKYPGVNWDKNLLKWKSRIGLGKKSYYLGVFNSEEEAYAAYLEAKAQMHTFNPIQR
jgi:hypothetical protein